MQTVPEVGEYIDLPRVRQRLDALPTLLAEGRQKEFKLGATVRALTLGKFLMQHYQTNSISS